MTKITFFVLLALSPLYLCGEVDFTSAQVISSRAQESKRIERMCIRNAPFYDIEEGESYRDITQQLLKSEITPDIIKAQIEKQKRSFVAFQYPSDGKIVKGYISFTPDCENAPLVVFLRGGSKMLGLMNPASDFSCIRNYTVIGTAYRDGISEGKDEFGGDDVNDVKNLVSYIPQIESMLKLRLNPAKRFILGASRGGMQMLLALQRFPFLQSYFDKAVSLSGPMNLHTTIASRDAMKQMFINDFGLVFNGNQEDWLNYRSPVKHCAALSNTQPLLIIQGKEDNRVMVDHGREMFKELKHLEKNATYWEIEGGTHCLTNHKDRMEMIANWLEND
ncbi:MAG: hypothetical protein S4CHLAM6_11820 [Chlamydiae bacterium]|nr:hypothetical protein [Chlamydiota bacterium]